MSINPATAAIKYAIEHPCDSPIEFLHCWYYGDFDAIRKEWENVPEDVFIGADPLHPLTKKHTRPPLRDGEPCAHPGCLHHVSHPCEGCGRIAGRTPNLT